MALEFIEEFQDTAIKQCKPRARYFEVSKGLISRAGADLRIVFATALEANATGIIMVHNYPSGQLLPSEADKYVTENMRKAGELLLFGYWVI